MLPRIFRARASGIGKLGASRVTLTGLARKLDSLKFPTGSGRFHPTLSKGIQANEKPAIFLAGFSFSSLCFFHCPNLASPFLR
jgi:hypothetical protein